MEERTRTQWRWNEERQCHESVEVPTGKFKFTDEDKILIVSEYVRGGITAQQIIEKYHISHCQTLFNWMDKFVNEKEMVTLPENQSENPMTKRNPEERVKELEVENKRLEEALKLERLLAKAYDTMINVAEQTFNIPIRKAGSYVIYRKGSRTYLVPYHGSKEMGTGLVKKIIKEMGLK